MSAYRDGMHEYGQHLDTMRGCPQCEARECIASLGPNVLPGSYAAGVRIVCRLALLDPHECAAESDGGASHEDH